VTIFVRNGTGGQTP